MNDSQMLHQMCRQALSNADVKAICKSRGFSDKEAASRALFENFFLSDIGVAAALDSLTKDEVVLLHLLKLIGQTVDVAFFARVYGTEQARYGTFTQRYKGVFDQARRSLVRKGVLLMAEDKTAWSAKTKMERWRFRFPREFERFLPPLIRSTRTFEGDGDVRSDVLKRKLMELVRGQPGLPIRLSKEYDLQLVDGELRMGDREFRARYLLEWQRAAWEASASSLGASSLTMKEKKIVSPVEATLYALSHLGENEWIRPSQLSLPLRIFCDAHLVGEEICTAGWEWGCLAKQKVDGQTYYRLPKPGTEADVDPGDYLHVPAGQTLIVNLETIPLQGLEHLAQMATMQVADSELAPSPVEGSAYLMASPNLIRLGNALQCVRDQPLVQWLRKNAPAFRRALEMVEQRWGKQIVHQDLMIARVADLGLKVQIERAFSGPEKIVFLPDDYVAFPRDLLPAIEKVITKSGHVIRTVQAHAP